MEPPATHCTYVIGRLHLYRVHEQAAPPRSTRRADIAKAIATYLTLAIEENDPSELAHALGVVARARGMDVAEHAGITRDALYKALRPGAQPRFDTVQRLCAAPPNNGTGTSHTSNNGLPVRDR